MQDTFVSDITTHVSNGYVNKSDRVLIYSLIPLLLFVVAFGLRLHFFSGFILGDDFEEFALFQQISVQGPNFQGPLQYRFPIWLFNVPLIKVGTSEPMFF